LRSRAAFAILLAALLASGAAAADLRTLFHTPEERARLDRLRRGEPLEAQAAPRAPRVPAVTGFVKRSDGRDTVWLDGTPKALTGAASAPYTDASKVRGRERPEAPPIEIKRSR
jgi:hypothetical protein